MEEKFGLMEWAILIVFVVGLVECGKWAMLGIKLVYKFFLGE